ncbi:MAG: UDP-N-acetylmuramoyl-L-alanine--D-glutamate ligase [Gemmatimonadota bacterium]|nr:UDP-N-acetylmuramoyl-L-alanine--D-glutamate ligase [Gemmatimonadota bacterium]
MIPEAWRRGEVAVVGLGRSGLAATRWLLRHGLRVYASDRASTAALHEAAKALRAEGADVDVGGHALQRIAAATSVVVSPGVPPDAPPIAAARAAGVDVVAEIDLGVRAFDQSRCIAVTGTNGKTTTTALIAHVLNTGGLAAAAVGNIGRPLTDLAADPARPDWIVVEVSSFQLHDAPHLAPLIGVVTNLAPDHLDRYADVLAYYNDKKLLFRNAEESSTWVLNGDDPAVGALAVGASGQRREWSLQRPRDAWYDRETARLMLGAAVLVDRSELPLLGDHNVANALAAALAAVAAGVDPGQVARGLRTFSAPAHRLERVGRVRDVEWINDSKATNVSAASVALRSMTGPFVLILGGRPKGEDFAALKDALSAGCRAVVAYGEAAKAIARSLGGATSVETVDRFDDAVLLAGTHAAPGDAVLLSPACASFDQFNNFEERGDRFRELVQNL